MARAKQLHLPGLEPVVNKQVEKLADEYVEARDGRMEMLKTECEVKAKLIQALKDAKLVVYKRGEYYVKLDSLDKVKVKIGAEKDEDSKGQ